MEIPSTKTVSNKIINAFLEAIYDVLDADGKLSIIRHAKLDYLKKSLPPKGEIPYDDFVKLVNSMNSLLCYSDQVIYEIGRKFSFYLSPFGNQIENLLPFLEENLFQDIDIQIERKKNTLILIRMNRCPFCQGALSIVPNLGDDTYKCEFFKGFLYETVKKATGHRASININQIKKEDMQCEFEVHLDSKES